MSALAELEKFGYLSRSKVINEKGQFSGMEYNIFEEPQWEDPVAENQNAEKPNSGKSNSANPPLLNTNIKSSTNSIKNDYNKIPKPEAEYLLGFSDILKHIEEKELRNLYVDYVEMRRLTGSPVTPRGLSMIINRCAKLAKFDIPLQKQMLEEAIINNWKSVYLPKEIEQKNAEYVQDKLQELKEFYEE